MISRLENFFLDRYASLMKVTVRKQGNTNIIIVILHDHHHHQEILNTAFEDLKAKEGADTPTFHNYDPEAISAEKRLRTLNVRNIPLRITKPNLDNFFKKYGIISSIKLRVPHNSLFQSAEIIYSDATTVDQFIQGRWGMFIMGECVRIYPARLTKSEHDARHLHTAVLRNVPRNVHPSDFMKLH